MKSQHMRNIIMGFIILTIPISISIYPSHTIINKSVENVDEQFYANNPTKTSKTINKDTNLLISMQEDFNSKNPAILKAKDDLKFIDIEISYYTNNISDCGKTDSISANGTDLNKYVLSRGGNPDDYYIPIACPKNIPFGTKIYIKGLGKCIAIDRGSAIKWKGNTMKVDVYIPNSTQKALNQLGLKQSIGHIIKE